jgi:hypothetical protein
MTLYEESAAFPLARFDCIDWRDRYAISTIFKVVAKNGGGGVPRRVYCTYEIRLCTESVSSVRHPIPLVILVLTHPRTGLPSGRSAMAKREPTRPIQALGVILNGPSQPLWPNRDDSH